jgi:hypothetical protein
MEEWIRRWTDRLTPEVEACPAVSAAKAEDPLLGMDVKLKVENGRK